ncbi:ParB/RepB/Spo0J family partition protein [Candidatus Bathyarchaeota archaeon]|nr:ParB/RepB/Spo0J family partition protein [Candidatus Bathyarchaeota archaeon]
MPETRKIPISCVIVSGDNPRRSFDEKQLKELGESIRTHGLLQPIIVRPKGNYYDLIIGERRLKASELVGLTEIDARIEDFDDVTTMEIRLIENTHREDLTDAEKGDAIYTLWQRFPEKYPSIDSIATVIGMSSTTVRNWCEKSQKLSDKVRGYIARDELTERAAQELLKYDRETQVKLARAIIKFDIRGGREGAERRFLRYYDENPNADLEKLAEKAKEGEMVRVPLEELSMKARKEVERLVEERQKETQERRKKAREEPRRSHPRRIKPKQRPEEKVREKANTLTEKLSRLEPEKKEEIAESVERRLDTITKSIDKENIDLMEKWKSERESEIIPRVDEESPEHYAMKLEEVIHGVWFMIGAEYPQKGKEIAQAKRVGSFSTDRLERLNKTIKATRQYLDEFNSVIESELRRRNYRVK